MAEGAGMDPKLKTAGALLLIAVFTQVMAFMLLREAGMVVLGTDLTGIEGRMGWSLQVMSLIASASGLVLAFMARD